MGRHDMANSKPQTTMIDRSRVITNIVRILAEAACANEHANESQMREQPFIRFSQFLGGGSTMPHRRIALPPVVVCFW